MRTTRIVPLIALAGVLLALPGCPAFTNLLKVTGLKQPKAFELPDNIPPDFKFSVHVRAQPAPSPEYLIKFDRESNDLTYRVTVPGSTPKITEGKRGLYENEIIDLYDALRSGGYVEMETSFPEAGEKGKVHGMQDYYVLSDRAEKHVWLHYAVPPDGLEGVRRMAVSLVPKRAWTGKGPSDPDAEPEHYVGDTMNRTFLPSDHPDAKKIPAERRIIFATKWQALDHGYTPADPDTMTPGR